MTLLAGFHGAAAALHRAGRSRGGRRRSPAATGPSSRALIGFFVNTLVLRDGPRRAIRASASCSPGCARRRSPPTRTRTCRSSAWSRSCAPERDLSRPPLFQVMFALENAPEGALEHPGIGSSWKPPGWGARQFELTCTCRETRRACSARSTTAGTCSTAATMVRLGGHLERLLSRRAGRAATAARGAALLARRRAPPAPGRMERHGGGLPARPHPARAGRGAGRSDARRGGRGGRGRAGSPTASWWTAPANWPAIWPGSAWSRTAGWACCWSARSQMIAGLLGVLEAGAAYVPLDPTLPGGAAGDARRGRRPRRGGHPGPVLGAAAGGRGRRWCSSTRGGGRAWRSDGRSGRAAAGPWVRASPTSSTPPARPARPRG